MKFFIDAGHGGSESGAIGNGMIEKNINLIVAKEVKRILELNKQTVVMSRETDITIGVSDRPILANNCGADLLVSIHHNANDGISSGAEVYASVTGGFGLIVAKDIAYQFESIGRKTLIKQRDSESNPGVGQDYYSIIRNSRMPAIITEFGYIDSKDYINFDTPEELMMEAKAIANSCLTAANITNIIYTDIQIKEHWAQSSFDYLKAKGIKINETRFDDKMTRGEFLVLFAQLVK